MTDAKQLSDAVWVGDLDTVQKLLAAGVNPNTPDEDREPPLHLAIEQMEVEIAHHLVEAGAELNKDLGRGWTPLVHAIDIESDAAWQKHHELNRETTQLTELLLAAGAKATPEAFEIAHNYFNRKALALLEKARQA